MGERNKILAARSGDESVTERTKRIEVMEDDQDSWVVMQ